MLIEVPDLTGKECGDIAVTAAEGGINYWARIPNYDPRRWHTEDWLDTLDVGDSFVFYLITLENPIGPGRQNSTITPKVIRRGIELALQGGKIRRDLEDQMRDVEERAAMDADAADCVIQLGVFGEVVFG